MNYIKSKDLCFLITDALKMTNKGLIEQGQRVSYIFYHLLKTKEVLEDFELAEYTFIGMLHDIGILRSGEVPDIQFRDDIAYIPHCIYGYLYMKYLSPFGEKTKAILYHHSNYIDMKKIDYSEAWAGDYLHFAEILERFWRGEGKDFNYEQFEQYVGKRFSRDAYLMLSKVMELTDIFQHLEDESYIQELEIIMDDIMLNNGEKKKLAEMLMYCTGFHNSEFVGNAISVVCITSELGKQFGLNEDEMQRLYYAILFRNVGFLSPGTKLLKEIPEHPLEINIIRQSYLFICENTLKDRIDGNLYQLIVRKFEKGDGSGYPNNLKDKDMTLSQKILQVADAVIIKGVKQYVYSEDLVVSEKESLEFLENLNKERKYNPVVIKILSNHVKEILESVRVQQTEKIKKYNLIEAKYKTIMNNYQMSKNLYDD